MPPMSAIEERRRADLAALERLARASRGQLVLLRPPGPGQPRIELELRVPLAGDRSYPQRRRMATTLFIDLPSRYPFEPPIVRLPDGALPHPNVFESGVVCIGNRWRASEGLDLFVLRVARLLCFDPLLVNLQSLANPTAAGWYRGVLRQHPEAFPTARIDWPDSPVGDEKVAAADSGAATEERVIRACPACAMKLRLPAGRSGLVECPRCHHAFDTRT